MVNNSDVLGSIPDVPLSITKKIGGVFLKRNIVLRNMYRKHANLKKYIEQYSSRESATQAIYPTYDELGNAQLDKKDYKYLDGLAFDNSSLSLSRSDMRNKASDMQAWLDKSEDNKSMLMVISFDSDYLLKHNLIRSKPQKRGDLFENVDELRLRYSLKKALNAYQDTFDEKTDWLGCLQFDTLHAHAHVVFNGNPTGMLNDKGKDVIRTTFEQSLNLTKDYAPNFNRRRDFLLEKENQAEKETIANVKDAVGLQRYIKGDITMDDYVKDVCLNHGLSMSKETLNLAKQRINQNLSHHEEVPKRSRLNKLLDIPRQLNQRAREHLNRAYDLWRADDYYDKQVQEGIKDPSLKPKAESKVMQDFYQSELMYEVKAAEKYRQFLPFRPVKDKTDDLLIQRNRVLKSAMENGDLQNETNNLPLPLALKLGGGTPVPPDKKLSKQEIEKLRKEKEFDDSYLDNQRLKAKVSPSTQYELIKYQRMMKKRAKKGFLQRLLSAADVEDSLTVVGEKGFIKYPVIREKHEIDKEIDYLELGKTPKNLGKYQNISKRRIIAFDRAKAYLKKTFQNSALVQRFEKRLEQVRESLKEKFNFKDYQQQNESVNEKRETLTDRFNQYNNQSSNASLSNSSENTIGFDAAKVISEEHRNVIERGAKENASEFEL
ncbi:hypothetical protein [Ligilactobacillus equi]|uniref:hypothetical protein n=1 Tax=Ligilactobacillus equi TaxID=137357 RepID=UPI000704BCBB|nr:hypothetical protein [Ligilactobacillus equi]